MSAVPTPKPSRRSEPIITSIFDSERVLSFNDFLGAGLGILGFLNSLGAARNKQIQEQLNLSFELNRAREIGLDIETGFGNSLAQNADLIRRQVDIARQYGNTAAEALTVFTTRQRGATPPRLPRRPVRLLVRAPDHHREDSRRGGYAVPPWDLLRSPGRHCGGPPRRLRGLPPDRRH